MTVKKTKTLTIAEMPSKKEQTAGESSNERAHFARRLVSEARVLAPSTIEAEHSLAHQHARCGKSAFEPERHPLLLQVQQKNYPQPFRKNASAAKTSLNPFVEPVSILSWDIMGVNGILWFFAFHKLIHRRCFFLDFVGCHAGCAIVLMIVIEALEKNKKDLQCVMVNFLFRLKDKTS